MANRPKALGTELETALKGYLRENGWPYADRIVLHGGKDVGDVRLSERIPFVLEGKSAKSTTDRAAIGTWLRELQTEVSNANAISGAVVHKKRGTTDVGEYVAIMPVKYLNVLLRLAFPGEPTVQEAPDPPRRRKVVIPPYRG